MKLTPLHCLISYRPTSTSDIFLKLLEYLIDAGADLKARDQNGFTPLHSAVVNNNLFALNYCRTNPKIKIAELVNKELNKIAKQLTFDLN